MENFVVSARKYRPSTFNTVVGQKHITTTLKNAIQNNHLAQAFLFCGPRGVGKTTNARILAKTINCQNLTEDIEPCNECDSCQSFNNNHSFNIQELDAASNNSVEDIRTLVEQVRYPPQAGKYKIYIIDEVHMLSNAAFNAFLKTLEEPPPYAIFILATTEKHKIIPTILSRCQIFDFNRIQVKDISEHLGYIASEEKIEADEEALDLIAQKADGALRDALSMFDLMVTFSSDNSIRYKNVIDNLHILDYDYYFKVTDLLLANKLADILVIFDEILKKGFDGHNFIIGLAEHFRNLMVCKDKITIDLLEVSQSIKERYLEQAKECSTSFLLSALNLASKCDQEYKGSKNQRLHVELALMKICYIEQAIQLSQQPIQPLPTQTVPVQEKKNDNLNQVAEQTTNYHTSPEPNHQVKETNKPVTQISKNSSTTDIPKEEKKILKSFGGFQNDRFKSTTKIPTTPPTRTQQKPVQQTTKEPIHYGNETFSAHQAMFHWKNYVEIIKKQGKHTLHIALNRNISVSETYLTLEVNNQAQIEEVNRNKEHLLRYLKENLKNNEVSLVTKISATPPPQTAPPTNHTSGEKFKVLLEKNPLLENFRQELGLDINF